MYHPTLRPKAQRQLKKIKQADLVVGLPSYKNPRMAVHVTQVVLNSVHKYYPDLRVVLINADAGHKATTRKAVAEQGNQNGHHCTIVSSRYDGLLGPGSASAASMDAALALDAKAIVILDSHTQSISPNWVPGLAHLILEDKADLVVPRYRRWLLPNGILNDLIAYPLVRALWGQSVRHPIASDLALSPELATTILDEDVWGTEVAQYGLSPWLISHSVVTGWRLAQSALGEKNSDTSWPYGQDLATTNKKLARQFRVHFNDVVSLLFRLVSRYRDYWENADKIRSIPTLTHFASATDTDPPSEQEITHLLDNLALGWMEYRRLWQEILTPDNLMHVEALASLPADRFYFPADLWARIIYDFAVVFNKGERDPNQIVESLLPLYCGRKAAFSQEVAGLAFVGREGTVAAQAVEFEEIRPYLQNRWQTYRP